AARAMVNKLGLGGGRRSSAPDQSPEDQSRAASDDSISQPEPSIESVVEMMNNVISLDEPGSSSSSVDEDTSGRGTKVFEELSQLLKRGFKDLKLENTPLGGGRFRCKGSYGEPGECVSA